MLIKAIELMELEIERLKNIAKSLHEDGLYQRETYRKGEIKRLQRVLNLLIVAGETSNAG